MHGSHREGLGLRSFELTSQEVEVGGPQVQPQVQNRKPATTHQLQEGNPAHRSLGQQDVHITFPPELGLGLHFGLADGSFQVPVMKLPFTGNEVDNSNTSVRQVPGSQAPRPPVFL